jgi:hypothetical protein
MERTSSKQRSEIIAEAYRVWGIPAEKAQTEYTAPEEFAETLAEIAPQIPHIPCSFAPSSFDPSNEAMRIYPQPLESVWESCVPLLSAFDCTGVMLNAPIFWQVEQTLFRACKKAGAFIFANDALNMPLGAYALEAANIDAIVASADDAHEFAALLAERGKKPKLWIIAHDASKALPDTSKDFTHGGAAVAREMHVFPGVPVLVQCPALAKSRINLFHVHDAYLLESSKNGTLATSLSDEPLPLWRYALPFSIAEKGACECGKTLLEIRAL